MHLLIFLIEDSLVPEIARIYKTDGRKLNALKMEILMFMCSGYENLSSDLEMFTEM